MEADGQDMRPEPLEERRSAWLHAGRGIRVYAGDGSISLNGPMQSTTARLPAISPIIPARRSAI
jgi:hypothetical protein